MGISHTERRKLIIRKIGATIVKLDKPLDKDSRETLIAMIMAEHGTARRTAREYLQASEILVKQGVFKKNDI